MVACVLLAALLTLPPHFRIDRQCARLATTPSRICRLTPPPIIKNRKCGGTAMHGEIDENFAHRRYSTVARNRRPLAGRAALARRAPHGGEGSTQQRSPDLRAG